MKPRKKVNAAKIEAEIKKDFYTSIPPPSDIMNEPTGELGKSVQGLRARRIGADDEQS